MMYKHSCLSEVFPDIDHTGYVPINMENVFSFLGLWKKTKTNKTRIIRLFWKSGKQIVSAMLKINVFQKTNRP